MNINTFREYQIQAFGQTFISQGGLFRLDDIRKAGVASGVVEDNRYTLIAKWVTLKVGKHLRDTGELTVVRRGELGAEWYATPVAAVEYLCWADPVYRIRMHEAFIAMTSSPAVQAAFEAESIQS